MKTSAEIIQFPPRCSAAIWITREDSAWLVLSGAHGWICGDRETARREATWLSQNRDLPVREVSP